MIKQAIIPLAGLGTRLLPLTSVFAKELLPINGKRIVVLEWPHLYWQIVCWTDGKFFRMVQLCGPVAFVCSLRTDTLHVDVSRGGLAVNQTRFYTSGVTHRSLRRSQTSPTHCWMAPRTTSTAAGTAQPETAARRHSNGKKTGFWAIYV